VDQTLEVELTWLGTLSTSAKLPYDPTTLARYAQFLGVDPDERINPDYFGFVDLCAKIVARSKTAEDAVEGVCDWLNVNVRCDDSELKQGIDSRSTDQVFSQRHAQDDTLAKLVCAMLRHIGIPAETVYSLRVRSPWGHFFIEVYFPDAGWVLYDIDAHRRGFKTLNCLIASGFGFMHGPEGDLDWTDGNFYEASNVVPFLDSHEIVSHLAGQDPEGVEITRENVLPGPAAAGAGKRHGRILSDRAVRR
jgi:hypothetical protein